MMVRNEQNVIATCIGHLLSLGVARIYVTDNGSTDATPTILRGIATKTGKVVVNGNPGEFWQADVLTVMAHRAAAEGADWVLPTDADEFLWLENGASLQQLCNRSDIGGYRVRVRNFIQARPVRRDWPGSLNTMVVAAVPAGSVAGAQADVTSGAIPFVRMTYPTKLLIRATTSLQITFGHHDVHGAPGPIIPLERGELLHAPLRSFEDLRARLDTARRVLTVTPGPDQNWHLKRLLTMDDAGLAEEWRRNSYQLWRPIQRGQTGWDLRLAAITRRQADFRRRFVPT